MDGKIKAVITANSPVFVGGMTSGNIQMPYMLHLTNSDKTEQIGKKVFLDYIKTLRSFWIGCDRSSFGKSSKQSGLDFFKDRLFVASCSTTLSEMFGVLAKHMHSNKPLPQYVTKLVLSLTRKQQAELLQYTNENCELIVSIVDNVVYNNDPSKLFETKAEFMETLNNIDPELLQISSNMKVPVLTGNSIRGTIRDILMAYVIEKAFGDNPHKVLNVKQYHILFSGGLLTEGGGYDNIETKQQIRDALPFLSILGAMLGNEDLPGKIKVDFAMLRCIETGKNKRYANSYLKEYFSTRNDDYEGEITEEYTKRASAQMIYSKLFIQKGATFDRGVSYNHLTELEKSFLDLGLSLLQKKGKIGGTTRVGYGDVLIEFDGEINTELAETYLKNNVEKIKENLSILK